MDAQNSGEVRGRPFTGADDPRRNNGGRPKGDGWFRRLCRKRTIKALRTLEAAMESGEWGAAKALLEFAWGKAPAVVTMTDGPGDVLHGLTRDEVLALARAKLREAAQ